MAWTSPRTFVVGEVLTAANMNTHLRDNTNDLHLRTVYTENTVAATQTTASTSYTDLATVGPTVTVTTGTTAMVHLTIGTFNSAAANENFISVAVSGATTQAGSDANALRYTGSAEVRFGGGLLFTGLTAGSNTFTLKYRVTAGTGSFFNRHLVVHPGRQLA